MPRASPAQCMKQPETQGQKLTNSQVLLKPDPFILRIPTWVLSIFYIPPNGLNQPPLVCPQLIILSRAQSTLSLHSLLTSSC